MNLKQFINEAVIQHLNEEENRKILYHKISNKTDLNLEDFIKHIVNTGLIRHDNKEIGNVIWFSDNYNDYAKDGKFVVAIEYNSKNKEKYQIDYDNNNGYVYLDIPFKDLEVIKIPVLIIRSGIFDSLEMIRLINNNTVTPEKLNALSNVKIYGDIFNKYVQPFINVDNFLKKIDTDKITLINIFS